MKRDEKKLKDLSMKIKIYKDTIAVDDAEISAIVVDSIFEINTHINLKEEYIIIDNLFHFICNIHEVEDVILSLHDKIKKAQEIEFIFTSEFLGNNKNSVTIKLDSNFNTHSNIGPNNNNVTVNYDITFKRRKSI